MNLHLLKLFPAQVAKYWNELGPMVEQTLPPSANGNRMANILQAILSGRLEMLQYYDQDEDGKARIIGLAVVGVVSNLDYTSNDLLIYAVYAYGQSSRQEVVDGFQLLVNYARGVGCNAVTAYTNLPGLVKYIKRLGGQADYTFLRLEV